MMEGDGGTLPQWKGPKPWWTVLLVTCWLVVGVSTVSGNDTDVNALGGEFEAAFQGKKTERVWLLINYWLLA